MSNNLLTYDGPLGYLVDIASEQYKIPGELDLDSPLVINTGPGLSSLDAQIMERQFDFVQNKSAIRQSNKIRREWVVHYISRFEVEREFLYKGKISSTFNEERWSGSVRWRSRTAKIDQIIVREFRVGRRTVALTSAFVALAIVSVFISILCLTPFGRGGNTSLISFFIFMISAFFGLVANNRAMRELGIDGHHR